MLTELDADKRLKVFAVLDSFMGKDVSSLPFSEQQKLHDLVLGITSALGLVVKSDKFKVVAVDSMQDIEDRLGEIPNVVKEAKHELDRITNSASDIYKLNSVEGVVTDGGKVTCGSLDIMGDAVAALQMCLGEIADFGDGSNDIVSRMKLG